MIFFCMVLLSVYFVTKTNSNCLGEIVIIVDYEKIFLINLLERQAKRRKRRKQKEEKDFVTHYV